MDAQRTGDPDSEFRDWGHWAEGPGIITDIGRWGEILRALEPADDAFEAQGRIRALEELASVVAAAQAREAVAFHTQRVREDAANKVPKRQQGVHAGNELALAKRVSPATGRRFLSTSRAIVNDLPHTFESLAAGSISESKARIVADETAGLSSDERRAVDEELKDRVPAAGNRRLRGEARALAAEVSSETADEKAEAAAEDRHVTLSILDNGMGRVAAVLPLVQAIAAYESLQDEAKRLKSEHQAFGRTRDQMVCDTFVERLTGQNEATAVPTEVHLVLEAESLFSDGRVPAWLPGYGPLPAKTARNFLAASGAKMFVRRMFTSATTGQLVGMDSRRRTFGGLLRRMVVFRDDVCRTPWCDAPIKHADHVTPVAGGGETEWSNASGLCAACNYAKEHAGWKHEATPEDLTVVTPTGEHFESPTPPFVTKFGGASSSDSRTNSAPASSAESCAGTSTSSTPTTSPTSTSTSTSSVAGASPKSSPDDSIPVTDSSLADGSLMDGSAADSNDDDRQNSEPTAASQAEQPAELRDSEVIDFPKLSLVESLFDELIHRDTG